MSGPNFILDKGYTVAAAATGVDFGLGVDFNDADGKIVDLPAAAGYIVGVAQDTIDDDKIATGKAVVNVRVLGITRAVASEAIAVGDMIGVLASGKFRTAVAADRVVGMAMSTAAADGDHFNLLLTPGGGTA